MKIKVFVDKIKSPCYNFSWLTFRQNRKENLYELV